ncbi:MAG: oxygen-independent coproporphyrinogen III oxidase [Verrucomicrobia bacterium]|nr:oxygen-independent coproporphyrinogen III oxidase [Verrucomicrobiota bacterium]
MSALKVNLDLVQKYNVPGPRYTSYPPATQFTDTVPAERLLEKIRANSETDRDLSLYFHLPFCQSLCWFCGCTTVITTDRRMSATYLNYLEKELALMSPWLNPKRKVVQLHFGGGTPTFLSPDELRALGKLIHTHFKLAVDAEAGVEIDPRRVTRDHVQALREIGFNRASIGVQDHNPLVQKAVHRIQPFAQTKMVVDWIRNAGFTSLNIDLIYGLPHQTAASFEKTLDETLALNPDRLAVFSYAHVPWIKPAQKILADKILPSAEVKLQLLKLTIEKLTAGGYVYIGMDHFARADDELAVAQRQKTLQRNFQGYSTRGGADIYAFGLSSISQADGIYWQNLKELPQYYAALDEGRSPLAKGYILTDEDKIRRQTIMRLMCDLGLDYAAMSRKLGVDFQRYFERELNSLSDFEADGLVQKTKDGLVVTDTGRLFIRNIAMRFDAYNSSNQEKRFSKTI